MARLEYVSVAVFTVVTVVSSVVNSIAFVRIAQVMRSTSDIAFIVLCTTLIYSFIYLVIALLVVPKTEKRWDLGRAYALLGFLMGAGALLAQFSDLYVAGSYQSIFNTMSFPVTCIVMRYAVTGRPFQIAQLRSFGLVGLGIILVTVMPFIQPTKDNEGPTTLVGSIVYIAGVIIGTSGPDLLQQRLTAKPFSVNIWQQLAMGNVLSLPWIMLTPFVGAIVRGSFVKEFNGLAKSWDCFFEFRPLPDTCSPGAAIWIMTYNITYVIMYYCRTFLMKKLSVVYLSLVDALIVPITTLFFVIPSLGGEKITWYLIVGLLLVVAGVLVYREPPPTLEETYLLPMERTLSRTLDVAEVNRLLSAY